MQGSGDVERGGQYYNDFNSSAMMKPVPQQPGTQRQLPDCQPAWLVSLRDCSYRKCQINEALSSSPYIMNMYLLNMHKALRALMNMHIFMALRGTRSDACFNYAIDNVSFNPAQQSKSNLLLVIKKLT